MHHISSWLTAIQPKAVLALEGTICIPSVEAGYNYTPYGGRVGHRKRHSNLNWSAETNTPTGSCDKGRVWGMVDMCEQIQSQHKVCMKASTVQLMKFHELQYQNCSLMVSKIWKSSTWEEWVLKLEWVKLKLATVGVQLFKESVTKQPCLPHLGLLRSWIWCRRCRSRRSASLCDEAQGEWCSALSLQTVEISSPQWSLWWWYINHTLPYCITHVTHSNLLLFYQALPGGSKVTVATNYYIPLYNDVANLCRLMSVDIHWPSQDSPNNETE